MRKFYIIMSYGKEVPTKGKQFVHYGTKLVATKVATKMANRHGVRMRIMECVGQVRPNTNRFEVAKSWHKDK